MLARFIFVVLFSKYYGFVKKPLFNKNVIFEKELDWINGSMKISPQKIASWKIAPQKIATYENCPLWKYPPMKVPPFENSPIWKSPPWKLPPKKITPRKLTSRKFSPMKVATIVVRNWKMLPCNGGHGFGGSKDTYLIWHG